MIDVIVVGAGIVGLATARALLDRAPGLEVVVLDKERRVAAHQSGRNSGVIHAGVYYAPGTAKARLCLDGRRALQRFCAEHSVPFTIGGKVIVATDASELERLATLEGRARAHGIEVHRLTVDGLRDLEPHAQGIAALHVPSTGVVDFGAVSAALANDVRERGGTIRFGHAVEAVDDDPRHRSGPTVVTDRGELRARATVVCAGLHADGLARSSGAWPDGDRQAPLPRIIPFPHHPVPRRVPRAAPREEPPRPLVALSGARPAAALPRRAPHPGRARARPRRTQRGAGARSRGLRPR